MKKSVLKLIGLVLVLTTLFQLVLIPGMAAETTTTPNLPYGDVNHDDKVDAADALEVLKQAVGKVSMSEDDLILADVTGDTKVDAADALEILKYAVGKITRFPVQDNQTTPEPEPEPDPDVTPTDYVEPVGMKKGTLYNVNNQIMEGSDGRDHDMTRLLTSIQGLVNRHYGIHGVAINFNLDETDRDWLNYITQDGRTYENLTKVTISTKELFFKHFGPFIQHYGIIEWDPEVPSTANVAATICGLDSYLPVRYSEEEGSLYQILTKEYNVPVKQSLRNMFQGAQEGKKIAGTNIESSGSIKCDPYLWALEKYMDRCNTEYLAYTVDGGPSVPSNYLYNWKDAQSPSHCGIPNHDYFIAKQMFFFDLTSYSGEEPQDDPTQPLGTDQETMVKILTKRYELAGGKFGMVMGFPPWHVKYTTHCNSDSAGITNSLDAARLEWHFVEVTSSFNCAIEADAAHPCWMSNGSLYANYEIQNEVQANAEPKSDVTFDSGVMYYTLPYAGDYDCSPWLKLRTKKVFSDRALKNTDFHFSFNLNLVDRVPMAIDFINEKRTEQTYLLPAEGLGYVFQAALFEGFMGKEPLSMPECFTRTLPDGDKAYVEYAKPYYDFFKADVCTRVINGFTPMTENTMDKTMEPLSPRGNFLQNSTAGNCDFQIHDGTPYLRMFTFGGSTDSERYGNFYTQLNQQFIKGSNFTAFEYFDASVNYGTASGVSRFVSGFEDYMAEKYPNKVVQYLDVNTFLKLAVESKQGPIYR